MKMNAIFFMAALTLLAGCGRDDTSRPFADDPAVKGKWRSVDFVESPDKFVPGTRSWGGDLFLKGMTFNDGGGMFEGWWTWTKGHVLNKGEGFDSTYEIRRLGGKEYLFFEWKTGDYRYFHKTPWYYVLERGAYSGDGSDVIKDDIDRPFVDDPAVPGAWSSVDFVETPEKFSPGGRSWKGDLFLKELVFLPGGKSTNGWLTWTRGAVLHHGDSTASGYELRKIGGTEYMFFEWKSGDYTIRHRKPWYYVLKREGPLRMDRTDLPFRDDPNVVGEWTSVDFVETPDYFNPDNRAWNGELYLKGLKFLPGGKGGNPWWTWTRGVVMHHGDHTASRYTIKDVKGAKYMFFEWKSGDYVFRGAKPFYYVLKKK
ncbi:MAG: hypothetical protein M0025_05165 [Elusimicrobia bacterium]|nr:hypothetical protein [Elusimicrobiota bacterium]